MVNEDRPLGRNRGLKYIKRYLEKDTNRWDPYTKRRKVSPARYLSMIPCQNKKGTSRYLSNHRNTPQ